MEKDTTIREQKATQLRAYIEEKSLTGFSELAWDDRDMVSFQGTVLVEGQNVPISIDLDESVYTVIQFLIASSALKEGNEHALRTFINHANGNYSMLKYWLDNDGNLVLTVSIPAMVEHFDAELVIRMLEEVVVHLNTEYAGIMKVIWDN